MSPIDIIIPVYAGEIVTRACIESVLGSRLPEHTRLIIIDDRGPEPALSKYLVDTAASDPRIALLINDHNLGFVRSVNRGMQFDNRRDVVLLNSDTRVANDWLARLQAAAYRESRIGTVTPFSNNATICSYPRCCEENPLPAEISLDALDRLCAEYNASHEVDIPTAVGFCMYIRRDCIEEVGYFDAERFGRGYGEENDFCMRARRLGWRHVLATDTYVYHEGSVSFGDERIRLIEAAMSRLRTLHPDYEPLVFAHIRKDLAASDRLAIDLARLERSPFPNLLFIGHNRGGGIDKHMAELAHRLRDRCHILLLRPGDGQMLLEWLDPREALRLYFRLPDDWARLVQLLRYVGVLRIHYHHVSGLAPCLFGLPDALGVSYYFTVHDYYLACPQITFTGADNRYCGESDIAQCAACLAQTPEAIDITGWRSRWSDFLAGAGRVIAPSEAAACHMRRYFPTAAVEVQRHPDAEGEHLDTPVTVPTLSSDEPLRVVVLGALSPVKGPEVLEAAAKDAARRALPLRFHLIGYAYRALHCDRAGYLSVHGPYEDNALDALICDYKPHLVWFPALWPESYSYTLSACLRLGLPVVAVNLGAFPERLAGRPASWVCDWIQTPGDWNDFFLSLRPVFANADTRMLVGPVREPATFYTMRYLDGLRKIRSTIDMPAYRAEHLRPRRNRWDNLIITGKSATLDLVAHLRRQRVLTGIAKGIPLSWQRAVKDWLLR